MLMLLTLFIGTLLKKTLFSVMPKAEYEGAEYDLKIEKSHTALHSIQGFFWNVPLSVLEKTPVNSFSLFYRKTCEIRYMYKTFIIPQQSPKNERGMSCAPLGVFQAEALITYPTGVRAVRPLLIAKIYSAVSVFAMEQRSSLRHAAPHSVSSLDPHQIYL